jgi:hypothetical protein
MPEMRPDGVSAVMVRRLGRQSRQGLKPCRQVRQGDKRATPCLSRPQVTLADLLVKKAAPYPGSAGSLFDAHCERRRVGSHTECSCICFDAGEYGVEPWSAPGAIKDKPWAH